MFRNNIHALLILTITYVHHVFTLFFILRWYCEITNTYLSLILSRFNTLTANFTKWLNTLKQFVSNLPTNCLSVFDHFVGFALNGLTLVLLGTSQRFFFCLSLTVTTITNLLKYFWFALIFRGDYKSFLTILYVASRY